MKVGIAVVPKRVRTAFENGWKTPSGSSMCLSFPLYFFVSSFFLLSSSRSATDKCAWPVVVRGGREWFLVVVVQRVRGQAEARQQTTEQAHTELSLILDFSITILRAATVTRTLQIEKWGFSGGPSATRSAGNVRCSRRWSTGCFGGDRRAVCGIGRNGSRQVERSRKREKA